eukprot:Pgem_evm1s1103
MVQQESTLSSVESVLFADDASFYRVYRTPQQAQQQTQKPLDNIYEWMEKRKTKISTDEQLNYHYHLTQIIGKLNNKLRFLFSLKGIDWGSSTVTLIRTYKSILRSITDYSSAIAIIMMTPKDKEKLEIIQNKAMRLIAEVRQINRIKIEDLLQLTNPPTIEQRSRQMIYNYL